MAEGASSFWLTLCHLRVNNNNNKCVLRINVQHEHSAVTAAVTVAMIVAALEHENKAEKKL